MIELASLVEYGSVLRPNVVLWFYYESNDIANLGYRRNTILSKYVDDPNHRLNLVAFQENIDQHPLLSG